MRIPNESRFLPPIQGILYYGEFNKNSDFESYYYCRVKYLHWFLILIRFDVIMMTLQHTYYNVEDLASGNRKKEIILRRLKRTNPERYELLELLKMHEERQILEIGAYHRLMFNPYIQALFVIMGLISKKGNEFLEYLFTVTPTIPDMDTYDEIQMPLEVMT